MVQYDKMVVKKSTNPKKKYMAIFTDSSSGRTKTTHFGDSSATDYLLSKEKDRRARYIQRHKKDLKTNDPTRAGYLSLYLLWSYGNEKSTSLRTNISNYKKQFNFK
jgi:hypothetical protein